jgi:CBS domain-containing protein
VKRGGITIIGNLARAYAVGAGLTEKRTLGRLRAAAAAGVIPEPTARALDEAFRFLWSIRLEHQAAQARAGAPPDDHVDPAGLGPVARRGLKEAFRIIARAQRSLDNEMRLPSA